MRLKVALLALIAVGVWMLASPGSDSQASQAVPTCNGIPATIVGTPGNDVLFGTPGPDVIVGLGGNDMIIGLTGDDIICGGAGNDLIFSGPGDNMVFGGLDNDILIGGSGDDYIDGVLGSNICFGSGGVNALRNCTFTDVPTPRTASDSITPENSLIAVVSGKLNRPGEVYVEYRQADGDEVFRTAPVPSDGNNYETHVVRLKPETTYVYQVYGMDANGSTSAGPTGAFTTGALPSGLADTVYNVVSGSSTAEVTLMDHRGVGFGGIIGIDGDGDIVWYFETPDHSVGALDQKPNGNIVYTMSIAGAVHGFALREITPLGEEVARVDEPLCADTFRGPWHHEVHVLSDTEVMFLSRDVQDPFNDPTRLQEGDTIEIWDQTTNTVDEVWNVFDFIDPTVDRTAASNTTGGAMWMGCNGDQPYEDWTHGNAATRARDGSGDILFSARHLNQVVSIAPDFQSVNWRLGGPGSDFTFPDPSDQFYHQHASFLLENGNVLLFDNGNTRPAAEGGEYSRALELALDFDTMTAHKVWEYRHTPDLFAGCCSNAIRTDNGNTLLVFGSDFTADECCRTFTIVEADASGNPVWVVEHSSPFKTVQYRVYPADSILGEMRVP